MTSIPYELFEPVIGLEIHVQLNTKSKLFSVAPNRFGDAPNHNITDVCTGQPGTLPLLNREAVRKAVQFGCAVHATIARVSGFDRKSYFYPDSPRNFQITQYERPIILGGSVPARVGGEIKHFAIHRAHLEDDAGMLKHFSSFAGVDYNRAGAPLLEIVSEPCMHCPKEAVAYAMAIKAIMEYIGASDCNMEEGGLRIDTNVSVRRKNEKHLRNKIEIKNLNSFHFMEIALESEIRRQVREYALKPHEDPALVIQPGTFRFDPEKRETVLMRHKEEAADYRYFPEPDLVPIVLSEAIIDEIRSTLPELPLDRYRRYLTSLALSEGLASTLVNDKALCDYFEAALAFCTNPKSLSSWLAVEFTGRFKEKGIHLAHSGMPPQHVAKLVDLIDRAVITGKIAKSVADEMVRQPGRDPEEIVRSNPDYTPVHDSALIEPLVDQVIAQNASSVLDFRAGKTKAFDYLVGQVMKLCQGKASPNEVRKWLERKLQS